MRGTSIHQAFNLSVAFFQAEAFKQRRNLPVLPLFA
jgi:hypothetical protein